MNPSVEAALYYRGIVRDCLAELTDRSVVLSCQRLEAILEDAARDLCHLDSHVPQSRDWHRRISRALLHTIDGEYSDALSALTWACEHAEGLEEEGER